MEDDILDTILDDEVGDGKKENDTNDVISNIENKSSDVVDKRTEAPVKNKYNPGVGVDIGTSNIVVARQTKDGRFVNRYHRNMLYPLNVSDEAEDLLDRSDYLYVKVDDNYYVVGEDALRLANAIGKGEIVRPMKDGILNPSLKESSELLFYIVKAVVGKPIVENEPLRFSVPANPVDRDTDNLFHQMILENFFRKLGYDPKPVNEGMCVVYDNNPVMESDEGKFDLSGIGCSTGAGMWNLALSLKGLSLVEFSCTKSGDHLDEQVAKVTGIATNKVVKIKEKKLDLDNVDMSDRVQAALSIYYDEMVDRMIHHIKTKFDSVQSEMDGKIEIVVAGGTSMPSGFCNRLKKAIKSVDLPFDILDVRHSKTPFHSVSQGACVRALADYAKKNK